MWLDGRTASVATLRAKPQHLAPHLPDTMAIRKMNGTARVCVWRPASGVACGMRRAACGVPSG
eukprot:7983429-Alexandrium_andersonii.AAC.1